MKLRDSVVLIKPDVNKGESAFAVDEVVRNIGTVLMVADNVTFCKEGDKVVFFTNKVMIREFGWYVVDTDEILVNLSDIPEGMEVR